MYILSSRFINDDLQEMLLLLLLLLCLAQDSPVRNIIAPATMTSKANPTQPLGSSQQHSLGTYSQVANLNAKDLKALCLRHGIESDIPKKAKILFLCNILGISTTGNNNVSATVRSPTVLALSSSQIEEFERLTVRVLCTLNGWTKNLVEIPDVDESDAKRYLLQTDVLDSKSARTYKLSRPYQLKPFVHSMRYNNNASDNFGIIQSKCNPSQSTNPDDVKVVFAIIDKLTGTPYGGFCTCTVGMSERCGHIGATLFRLADLVASGIKQLPSDEKSCTDKLCEWTDPKGAESQPTVFDEVQISKKARTIRRTARDFGKKIENNNLPSVQSILTLRASLFDATHSTGQYCPAVHSINVDRFRENDSNVTAGPKSLPNVTDVMHPDLAYCREIEVTSKPLPIVDIPHKFSIDKNNLESEVDTFMTRVNVSMSGPERAEINNLTKGQSNNIDWYEQKKGAIGASNMSKVLKVIEKQTSYSSVVKGVMGYKAPKQIKPTTVPSLKWGLTNEPKARSTYVEKLKGWHIDLRVVESGLVVHEKFPFIRVSPDGIIKCKCHKDRLLEVKCPYASRDMKVVDAVQEKKINYLETENGRLVLKKNSSEGYYEQVQGLMGVLNIELCNLVVWTKVDMKIIVVPFDRNFWENRLLPACATFFRNHIVPEILAPKENQTRHTLPVIKRTESATQKTSSDPPRANAILYYCGSCRKPLPETDIAPDNSNASVGCDCNNCSCDTWFCWPCARYDEEQEEEKIDWFCPNCVRNCDIVY